VLEVPKVTMPPSMPRRRPLPPVNPQASHLPPPSDTLLPHHAHEPPHAAAAPYVAAPRPAPRGPDTLLPRVPRPALVTARRAGLAAAAAGIAIHFTRRLLRH
jgi:hypothetical protein